ncbi:MAG: cytochrome c [Nitrosomonas sp.]|uniref:c-type cytochrome n=1 Tax=Nitrosomonas sp. TaxID=42353 RepID=UPI0025FC5C5B|nr:cytochrome c [Nitrosomonas sp.]MCG7757325.1 cytochrome c [Nitrosomonas sp.]UJO99559.1 MAG: cytochrome c [Nitrosomonas sp.]UJP01661.1 MAG: cytochrome c [Nitrosomonas sp.]
MKEIKLRSVAIVFCFMFATTFAAINNAWSAQDEKNNPWFAWKDGAEIYAKICAYCHEAQVGPQIRNRDLPAAYIRAVVRNGNRAMPAFRPSEIDDESLVKLADFISKKEAQH